MSGFGVHGWADTLGVSPTTVWKWESYRMSPDAAHRAQIAAHAVFKGSYKDAAIEKRRELQQQLAEAAFQYSMTYVGKRAQLRTFEEAAS